MTERGQLKVDVLLRLARKEASDWLQIGNRLAFTRAKKSKKQKETYPADDETLARKYTKAEAGDQRWIGSGEDAVSLIFR